MFMTDETWALQLPLSESDLAMLDKAEAGAYLTDHHVVLHLDGQELNQNRPVVRSGRLILTHVPPAMIETYRQELQQHQQQQQSKQDDPQVEELVRSASSINLGESKLQLSIGYKKYLAKNIQLL